MSNLSQTNENLNQLANSLTRNTVSVTALGGAFKGLSAVLPIQELLKVQDTFSKLTRNLTATTKEIENLKSRIDLLSKSTATYSKQVLVEMTAQFTNSTSTLSLFIKEHDKLTERFVKTYRQDAPAYQAALVKLAEQMPTLERSIKQTSTSAGVLNEVFQRGGREGLAAYLTAIGKVKQETAAASETLSDSFKKLETSFDNLKLKVGGAGSGFLQGVVNFAANNPVIAGTALAAGGKYLGDAALRGIGSKLGLGGGGGGGIVEGMQFGPEMSMPRQWGRAYGKFVNQPFGLNRPNMRNLAIGGGLMLAGGVIQDAFASDQDGFNAGRAGGQLTSIAGASQIGYSFGGAYGAAGGAIFESGRQVYNAYAENSRVNSAGYRRKSIADAVEQVRTRGLELQFGENAALLAQGGGEPGSIQNSIGSINSLMAFVEGRRAGVKSGALSDPKYTMDAVIGLQNARLEAERVEAAAGARFGSVSAGAQFALETGGRINIGGLRSALNDRELAAKASLSTVQDNDPQAIQKRANVERELLSIKKERMQIDIMILEQEKTSSQLRQQEIQLNNGSLDSLKENLNIQAQISRKQAESLKAAGDEFGARKKLIEAAQKELEIKQLVAASNVAALQTSSFYLGLNGKMGPQAQAQQQFNTRLALQEQYRAETDPVKLVQLGQQLTQAQAQMRFTNSVAAPLFGKETSNMSFEQQMQAQGSVGAAGESEIIKRRIELIKMEIDLNEKNGTAIKQDMLDRMNLETKILELKLRQNDAYIKDQQQNEFTVNMQEKQVQLLSTITKNPFLVAQARGELLKQDREGLMIAQKKLEFLLKEKQEGRPVDQQAIRDAELQIMDKKLKIAQNFDIQRRTFAEQFTAQTINMSNGSYLFGSGLSDYATLGSGYYEGSSATGRKPRGQTYQRQVSAMFGQGMDERSPAEQLMESLIGTVSDLGKSEPLNVRVVVDERGQPVVDNVR